MNVINEKKLPKPLSDNEFEYYFRQFKEGSVLARDILVYHNIKLVYWYIKSHIRCDENDFDDIFSLGLEALVEAFNTYNFSQKTAISTYITIYVRNKILKYFRGEEKHNKVLSLDAPISDNDNTDTFGDMLIDDSFSFEEEIIEKDLVNYRMDVINSVLDSLEYIDRKIIMLKFGFDDGRVYVQREISEILGISQSQISKRLSRTLKLFKSELEMVEYEDIDRKMSLIRAA